MYAKRILATYVVLWVAWIVFTGSIPPQNYPQELLVGGVSSALVAGISAEIFTRNSGDMINPKRWGYLFAYIPVYIWAEVKAHLNVAYRILHPSLPMEPAIVKLPSELKSDVGLTALANSITMTPGTLSVDIKEDESDIFVHWITAKTTDEKGAHKEIGRPLEKYLKGGLG